MKRGILFFALVLQLLTMQAQCDTVVGIHGFITDWRSMKPIEHLFDKCGLNVYLWNYPSRRRCFHQHACNLIPILQEIACNCPGRPIHFVTHSSGAMILRIALNLPGCPQEAKIGRAVLLAPPNQGSSLAHYFRGFWPVDFAMGEKSGRELQCYGPCQMACLGEFPPSMRVLVVAGTKGNQVWFCEPNDGLIGVNETRLNTPHMHYCYPVKHGDMMRNHCVLCAMKRFIFGWYDCCYPEPACAGPGTCMPISSLERTLESSLDN